MSSYPKLRLARQQWCTVSCNLVCDLPQGQKQKKQRKRKRRPADQSSGRGGGRGQGDEAMPLRYNDSGVGPTFFDEVGLSFVKPIAP